MASSKYMESLNATAHARYLEKISIIGSPFAIPEQHWSTDPAALPSLTYIDMVNYLALGRSPFYEMKDFKNYKSLKAYDRFLVGWVRKVQSFEYRFVDKEQAAYYVIRAKVNHSQRLSEAPVQAWFICQEDGTIITAHCTCMAGIGETCSHVAPVMFYVEAAARIREKQTVTMEAAYWKLPSSRNGIEYAAIKDISFSSTDTLKKQLAESIGKDSVETEEPLPTKKIYQANFKQFDEFIGKVAKGKPSFLSVYPGHAKNFKPKVPQDLYPLVLTELYDEKFEKLDY